MSWKRGKSRWWINLKATRMRPRIYHRFLEWLAKKIMLFIATERRVMCNNLICQGYANNAVVITEEEGVKYYCKRCMSILLNKGYSGGWTTNE